MSFFKNKLSGLSRRVNSIKYGMFYWRNNAYHIPEKILINGKKTKLKVDNMNIIEFTGICINDCYQLGYLRNKLDSIKTIVDVGSNQGMFVIAARQFFPNATIHCYEPNPHLKETLSFNAHQLNAFYYSEAVMKEDCKVDLHFTESDLATTTTESTGGNVIGSSLATVINRIGEIDILKLDCEGSEWGLFENLESWQHIKSLTMEYHLWGRAGISLSDLFEILNNINFKLVHHTIANSQQGLLVAVNNKFI